MTRILDIVRPDIHLAQRGVVHVPEAVHRVRGRLHRGEIERLLHQQRAHELEAILVLRDPALQPLAILR